MTGGDDFIRGVSKKNIQNTQGLEERERQEQVSHSNPKQSRTQGTATGTVEERSFLSRNVKTKFTAAELNKFFTDGQKVFNNKSDLDGAMKLFILAADNGHHASQNALSQIYKDRGELDKSVYYLEMVASWNVMALAELAEAYEKGLGVGIDIDKAKNLYFEVAEKYQKRCDLNKSKESSMMDMELAVEYYEQASRLGMKDIQAQKAECLLKLADMQLQRNDSRKAIATYKKALEAGHPDAVSKLADCFFTLGQELEKNAKSSQVSKVKILDYYWKALQMGHPKAKEKVLVFAPQVAEMYETTGSVKNILNLADDFTTFILLRDLYLSGAVHPDMKRGDCFARFFQTIGGEKRIIRAYQPELVEAVVEIGALYASDPDLSVKEKAVEYYTYYKTFYKSHPGSDDLKNPEVVVARINRFYIELAEMYENGTGGAEVNQEKAFDYYFKALELDYKFSEERLADILSYWSQKSVELAEQPNFFDKLRAISYFDFLIQYKRKHPDTPIGDLPMGKLYFEIAGFYENGFDGNRLNLLEAHKCYEKAKELEYDVPTSKFADLEFRIGQMCESDTGAYTVSSAGMWYQMAISNGHSGAHFRYGMMHLKAEKTFHNQAIGFLNLKMAADKGYLGAIEKMLDPKIQAEMKVFVDDIIEKYETEEASQNFVLIGRDGQVLQDLIDLYFSGVIHPDLSIVDCAEKLFDRLKEDPTVLTWHLSRLANMMVRLISLYKGFPYVNDKNKALTHCLLYLDMYDSDPDHHIFSDVELVQSSMRTLNVELAEMFEKGTGGVEVDQETAYAYYAEAILAGHELPEAKVSEVDDYYRKTGLALAEKPGLNDKLEACDYFSYLIRYKELNPDSAVDYPPVGKLYFEVAELYEQGTDGINDKLRAIEYYKSAQVWEYDVPDIKWAELEYQIATMYESGTGVDMDKEKALGWYEEAMNYGSIDARFKYGLMHVQGEGVVPNAIVGYTHLKTAALMGQRDAVLWMIDQAEVHNDPMAQFTLGEVLRQGIDGRKPDLDKAIHYYQMAVKQEVSEAFFGLGEVYSSMDNFAEAMRYFQLGSERNNVDCHRKLANLYYKGAPGLAVNKHFALGYFERLAFAGDAEGQYMAGLIYYRGEDEMLLGPLYQRAVRHFEDAVNQGYAQAEYMLATMYLENKGVDAYLSAQDRQDRAMSLLKRASENGSEEAKIAYYELLHKGDRDRLD